MSIYYAAIDLKLWTKIPVAACDSVPGVELLWRLVSDQKLMSLGLGLYHHR